MHGIKSQMYNIVPQGGTMAVSGEAGMFIFLLDGNLPAPGTEEYVHDMVDCYLHIHPHGRLVGGGTYGATVHAGLFIIPTEEYTRMVTTDVDALQPNRPHRIEFRQWKSLDFLHDYSSVAAAGNNMMAQYAHSMHFVTRTPWRERSRDTLGLAITAFMTANTVTSGGLDIGVVGRTYSRHAS